MIWLLVWAALLLMAVVGMMVGAGVTVVAVVFVESGMVLLLMMMVGVGTVADIVVVVVEMVVDIVAVDMVVDYCWVVRTSSHSGHYMNHCIPDPSPLVLLNCYYDSHSH